MTNIIKTIKEWQQALQIEINHLKKFGQSKVALYNGIRLNTENDFTYYFESIGNLKVPIGSNVILHWGSLAVKGRVLSADGKSLLVILEKMIGEDIAEAYLSHDPWELLEQLQIRFDSIRKNKRKLSRIVKLMRPNDATKHPTEELKNHVHELSLRCKYNPVSFVWGPPGTGKTYTLARVALQRYWKGKRILVLAQSNQAVDVLLTEITTTIKEKDRFKLGDILRYGGNSSNGNLEQEQITSSSLLDKKDMDLAKQRQQFIEEKQKLKSDLANAFTIRDSSQLLEMEEKLASVMEKIRKREVQFVQKAKIVGTTLAKAATDPAIYEDEYDLVIVDEASMAYIPQVAFSASLAKRIIICGDFKQLPPIASSRHAIVDRWLKEDVFHATGVADTVHTSSMHPQLLLLNEQRRMHPSISEFTNKYIYHSLVGDYKNVEKKRKPIAAQSPFKDNASVLLDSSHFGSYATFEKASKSRMNYIHLLLALQVIQESLKEKEASIGYVTPYRAQAEIMEAMAIEFFPEAMADKRLIVATVHRFQGSERDVIVFDSVEAPSFSRPGMLLTGKESERLINVAISRAKGKFIHIANRSFIKTMIDHRKTIRQLINHQEQINKVVTNQHIGEWIQQKNPKLYWTHGQRIDLLTKDLARSQKEIFVSIPQSKETLNQEWKHIFSKAKIVTTPEIPFPVVIIDHKVVWFGFPIELVNGSKPPSLAIRIHSPYLASYLLNYIA
ncbi:AAA domain-containing protein [Niallia sp. MER TA 168]|uniref:AAA domain-containing protein n=1 Tax=Niallia sp. MER TA 168 TaxID=2939568 RepID=UPI00203BE26D|nr:AAA domain-containing protein [Niallia sp. MER TA 168]MCM3364146.1 AAA domain-containing protein [Niallia sp. MER TA 168]